MPHRIAGLVPILATPFDQQGALDLPSLRRLVEFQLWCGVDGIAVFGMASEGFALTADERARVLREARSVVGPRFPIVAGVNATSTATAVEQALAARDLGADALMVLPPFMVKPSETQLVDFYGEVAQRACVEVMVQDAPGVTGVTMPVPLLGELVKLAGVAAVKVEAPPTAVKVGRVVETVSDGVAVLGGQNALFVLDELAAGAAGTMPACEFADLLKDTLTRWSEGAKAGARASLGRLLPLIRFGMQPGIAWAVHKEVLVRRRVIASATVRLPAAPLPRASRAALDELLDDLGLPPYGGGTRREGGA